MLHGDDLNQVIWEQRVMSGDPKLEASRGLPDFAYARDAEVVGLKVSARTAITDPELPPLPPLPPHIKFQQAKKLAKALLDHPHRGRIIKESLKAEAEEFVAR